MTWLAGRRQRRRDLREVRLMEDPGAFGQPLYILICRGRAIHGREYMAAEWKAYQDAASRLGRRTRQALYVGNLGPGESAEVSLDDLDAAPRVFDADGNPR